MELEQERILWVTSLCDNLMDVNKHERRRLPSVFLSGPLNEPQRVPSDTCSGWEKIHSISRHTPAVILSVNQYMSTTDVELTKKPGNLYRQRHSYG